MIDSALHVNATAIFLHLNLVIK